MHSRLGRRGGSLLVYGLVWFVSGFPLLFIDLPMPFHIYAMRFWAALFVFGGATAIAVAWKQSPLADKVGFAALSLTGALWAVNCATLGVIALTTPKVGLPLEWFLNALTTALLVVKVNIDAGWSEPPTPVLACEERGDV